jgi:Tol biopolymer transport system component
MLAFAAAGTLKVIPSAGGPAQTLCSDLSGAVAGSWSRYGVILFTGSRGGSLKKVSAQGGPCASVGWTPKDGHSPQFLPDGRHFLYTVHNAGEAASNGIYLATLDEPDGRRVLPDTSIVRYSPATQGGKYGHLLFVRDGRLVAQAFDVDRLRFAGELIRIPTGRLVGSSFTGFSASGNGVLAYVSGGSGQSRLTWFDRSGRVVARLGPAALQNWISLSPGGKRVSVGRDNGIWLYETESGIETRLTFEGTGFPGGGVWSHDDSRVVFRARNSLRGIEAGGTGRETQFLTTENFAVPSDWSRDGRYLVYTASDAKSNADIWYLNEPLKGNGKPVVYLQTPFTESQGQLSPDGKWIAYVSDETGQFEVYVRSFPDGRDKRKISAAGGREPRWRADGRELFFARGGIRRTLFAAPARLTPSPAFGAPTALFEYDLTASFLPAINAFSYSPAADGRTFLVNARGETEERHGLEVLVNWQRLLAAKEP